MTPQDKAIALYTYYEELIKDFTKGVSINQLAKMCATKCVLEILDENNHLVWHDDDYQDFKIKYWVKVGQEINKLC